MHISVFYSYKNFFRPIERSRMRDAKQYERYLGNQLSEELQNTTGQYILRRTKAQVLEDKHNSFNDSDKVFLLVIKLKVKFYRKNMV